MKRSKPLGVIFDLGETVIHNVYFDWMPFNEKLLKLVVNNHGLTSEKLRAAGDRLNTELEKIKNESMIEHNMVNFFRILFETTEISLPISYEEVTRLCWNTAFRFVPQVSSRAPTLSSVSPTILPA
jgi:hypothetical protein